MGAATGRNNPDLGVLQLLRGLGGTLASAGRGALASTLGTPGDLEAIARTIPSWIKNPTLESFANNFQRSSQESFLPTTEDMATKHLPQLPKEFQQPTVEQLGQFAAVGPKGALALASNPALLSVAAGAHGLPGGLGIIGRRGADQLGRSSIQRRLEDEFNAAAKVKARGEDPRMKGNSGSSTTWTGFDLKPRAEMDTLGFKPKHLRPTDNFVPVQDLWNLEDWFKKAYPELSDNMMVHHSNDVLLGNGSYDPSAKQMVIGVNQSNLSPANQNFITNQYPHILESQLINTFGHEGLGHAVADVERFTQGTNKSRMGDLLASNSRPMLMDKNELSSQFLRELVTSSNPHNVAATYVAKDPSLRRFVQQSLQNLMTGKLDPQDAMELAGHYSSEADRLRETWQNSQSLHSILNSGLRDFAPEDVMKSAEFFQREAPPNLGYHSGDAYKVYRANSGENEAELIAGRMLERMIDKSDTPLVEENEIPVKYLHNFRR